MAMDSPEGNLEPTEVLQRNLSMESLTEENQSSDLASSSPEVEDFDTSNLHLMMQTEDLLARMEDIKASTSGRPAPSSRRARDPDAPSPSNKAEQSIVVNTMLGKAEKLASMMISPSDHSAPEPSELLESSSSSVDPLLGNISEVRKRAVARALRQNRVNAEAFLAQQHEKSDSPEKTEPTSDEMSSRAPSLDRRDPPGKSSMKKLTLDPPDNSNNFGSSDLSMESHTERPASTVHVEMTEDDVSSVGSPSFPVPAAKDLVNSMRSVSEMNSALDAMIKPDNEDRDKYIPNAAPPFLDPDTGIQWVKVSTARSGEDDYAPLVDYSNVKPSAAPVVSAPSTPTSRARLSLKKRRRSQAKLVAWGIILAILVWFFFAFSEVEEIEEQPEEEIIIEEVEEEPLFISFDAGDSCFEGMEFKTANFLIEVLRVPEVIEEVEVEEEEPKQRGILGLFRNLAK